MTSSALETGVDAGPVGSRVSGALSAVAQSTGAGEGQSSIALHELGLLEASAAEQMALDEGLLEGRGLSVAERDGVIVRRYAWTPPAVSLGKFQRFDGAAAARLRAAGLDVVRRPSGGRLVLHGAAFEWSFTVALPARLLPYGTHAAYRLVAGAMAAALDSLGRAPDQKDAESRGPYTRSALCFATALPHDLLLDGRKAVAVAQVRRGDRLLVHGSVLERRPPARLVAAVEEAVGEPWRGDGFVGAVERGGPPDRAALWRAFVARLGASLTKPRTRDGTS